MNMQRFNIAGFLYAALGIAALAAGGAQAVPLLTPAGVAAGFTLSTFADSFPNSSAVGPLGIGFLSGGGVIVSDYPGNVRIFPSDADGQHANTVPVAQNYGLANAVGIAQVGQTFYMSRQGIGDLIQINPDGTFNQFIIGGLPGATGVATNPANGHIFVSTLGNNVIWDVDPIAKSKTAFAIVSADGIGFSPDGAILFAEANSRILGFNAVTGVQVFDSGFIGGGPDGAAAGTGTLAGQLFVNTNDGHLISIDVTTLVQTVIMEGASRGDFVTVDPNGTLLLTESDLILRLTPGAGGCFGAVCTVPEPGSLAILGLGLAGVGFSRRKRRVS